MAWQLGEFPPLVWGGEFPPNNWGGIPPKQMIFCLGGIPPKQVGGNSPQTNDFLFGGNSPKQVGGNSPQTIKGESPQTSGGDSPQSPSHLRDCLRLSGALKQEEKNSGSRLSQARPTATHNIYYFSTSSSLVLGSICNSFEIHLKFI